MRIDSVARADVAARLGAVAIFASIPYSLLPLVFANTSAAVDAAIAASARTPEERLVFDAMSSAAPQTTLIFWGVGALISCIVGLVQWRDRTRIIPALGILFCAYPLVMTPLEWNEPVAIAIRSSQPAILALLDIVVSAIGLAMCWAAFRGASWLERERRRERQASGG